MPATKEAQMKKQNSIRNIMLPRGNLKNKINAYDKINSGKKESDWKNY